MRAPLRCRRRNHSHSSVALPRSTVHDPRTPRSLSSRDSRTPTGPVIAFGRTAWRAFVAQVE
ncbi:DUF397 domain-containing protein [Streptomyces sp. NPDC088350]|uniref:DUF397 domain-containing protein n=1 Tax=Streptomyces sp. NPDC088350 TaxID=3365854 RepID=UPI00380EEA7C